MQRTAGDFYLLIPFNSL